MALPVSGPISISQIAVELGRASNAAVSFHEPAARALAGKPTGPVSITDFYGKSSYSAIWSGSSDTGGYMLQTSASSFRTRIYGTTWAGPFETVGPWATAYTDGTFSSTISISGYPYMFASSPVGGFQTSGNALRAYDTLTGVVSTGAWLFFDRVSKWSTGTSSPYYGIAPRYEGSAGFIRIFNAFAPAYGAWINLN